MKRLNIRWTARVAVAVFISGCASSSSVRPAAAPVQYQTDVKAAQVEPRARGLFAQAEAAFKAKKYKEAIEGYRTLMKRFPGSNAHQLAAYRVGGILYASGNYAQASQEFYAFLKQFPKSDLAFDVTYNLAASEFQQGRYANAAEWVGQIPAATIRAQGPRRAEVVYQLGAQASAMQGKHGQAIAYYAAVLQLPLDEAKRDGVFSSIARYLEQMQSPEELNNLLTVISEPTTRARIGERVAALTAPSASAMSSLSPLQQDSGAEATLGLRADTSGRRNHVGVVLPLSGANAVYGRRALDGILLAAGVFQQSGGPDVQVFVEDSESNPALAAQAVERLVREHDVIAIIGPISWRESLATADAAQELGVLNLSLTGKEGISERGAYLFQNALTPRVQMENLVRHAIQEKGFKRFAILAPDSPFGDDMATQFIAVAQRLGGHVVGYENYPPDTRDFQAPVQRLVGVAEPRYRRMETAKLELFKKEYLERNRRQSKARLPPIVDFDAIFIPDSPRAVSQIAASLAYFDATGIKLLGTSEWNSDQLYKRGGRLVEGAMFPGALQLSSGSARQRDFIRQYAQAYGGVPDLLAAQAFEALELVGRAASGTSGNRNSVVSELMRVQRYESPLGVLSFDQSRIALRSLPIFSLEPGGNIVEQ